MLHYITNYFHSNNQIRSILANKADFSNSLTGFKYTLYSRGS